MKSDYGKPAKIGVGLSEERWREIFGEVEEQLHIDDAKVLELLNRRLPKSKQYKSIDEFWEGAWKK